ncbi:MAG TPA: hypothetical protein VLB02_02575 [Candidatus Paceibacterota bacterium]|nr:hypothetical protein [Candidatus Paceibacterota bacterium]
MTTTPSIDFDTMRSNCIQIHQECFELSLVTKKLNIPVQTIPHDELSTNEKTKTWNDMGRYAKELFDNDKMWATLPEKLDIELRTGTKTWSKNEAKKSLLDCYKNLGGELLSV